MFFYDIIFDTKITPLVRSLFGSQKVVLIEGFIVYFKDYSVRLVKVKLVEFSQKYLRWPN